MKSKDPKEKRKPGRPLSFDREAALKAAMMLFWRYGYEATSIHSLTGAMGITPPSLYAAFGDKKQLFREAVDLYVHGGESSAAAIIGSAPTAREAVERLLEASAIGLTGEDTPPGCMLVSSATNCSPESLDVQQALSHMRRENEGLLRHKIEDDRACGSISAEADAEALASLFMGVVQGMSTQARDGASRQKLLAMAKTAMRAWPEI